MTEKSNIAQQKRKITKKMILGFSLLCIICIASAISIKNGQDKQDICIECSDSERTLQSLVKLDNYPLYYLELWGDYGFDQYLQTGINDWVEEREGKSAQNTWACTIFTTLNNDSDYLYGRNFDWEDGPKLLLFTNATDAYASYSMVDLEIADFSSEQQFLEASYEDYLEIAYLPLDGMNEHGLSIGCMTASGSENILDPNKTTLGSLNIMRLALDYAKSVNEVVELWRGYNVYFPTGPPVHYLVADAMGNSAIIEFTDGDMQVIPNQNPWQVSTNFLLYGSTDTDKNNCWRYSLVEEILQENQGELTIQEALDILEAASQDWSGGGTQWSNVYNMDSKEISIVMGMEYSRTRHTFTFM